MTGTASLYPAGRFQAAAETDPAAPPGALGPLFAFGAVGTMLQAAVVILQVVCVVHVIRRREDYWWILLILFFPGIGSLAYLFAVILPEWRRRPRFRRGAGGRGPREARRRLPQLEKQLAVSQTVEHRAELAAAYCEAGEYALARQSYEGCLQGPHANDPHLLFGLAKACFGEGHFERSLECAARVDRRELPESIRDLELLEARARLAVGRTDEAIAGLKALAPRAAGLEPWWLLTEALAQRGEKDAAEEACRRLLEESSRLGPAARKREKPWIALAKERLQKRAVPTSGPATTRS